MNGMMNGKGLLQYPDGKQYVGEFKDDKVHGYGVLLTIEGGKYEGAWENGFKSGHGTEVD